MDYLVKAEFDKMISSSEYKILDTIPVTKSVIFEIYQDEGALGGHKFYLLHKNGSEKYHYILYPDSTDNLMKLENKLN